jgi:hypothetical protein
MTKKKSPDQLQKNGRKSTFLVQYVDIARRMAYLGATDQDLAIAFNTSISAIWRWKALHPDFRQALKLGKKEADEQVERSLYERARGYSYDSVKIFLPYGSTTPVYAPFVEHVPPDTTAAIFWLKNRDPARWRDAWQLEHVTGKYVVSDRTLTEDEWIRERGADVIEGEVVAIEPPKTDDKN